MDKQVVEDLYNRALSQGYNKTLEEFQTLLTTDSEVIEDNYQHVSSLGYNKSIEDFKILIGVNQIENELNLIDPQPKKSETEQDTSSTTTINLDIPIGGNIVNTMPQVRAYNAGENNPNQEEKLTGFEKTFGENEFTDFFGDLARAWNQGQAQGGTIDDAIAVWRKGNEISDEELEEYIKASARMDATGTSDEMKDFNYEYEKEGGGISGFIMGVLKNPTVVPQLFLSSVSSMTNKSVGGAAVAGAAGGAAIGSSGFSAGILGVFTTAGGAIGGAIGAAGATLEAGLSFTEFLREELQAKNLPFTKEAIRKVLADEEAMTSIQNRALGRGITIGLIDALTGGIAGKVTTAVAKGVGKGIARGARKAATKSLVGGAAGGGVEAVGGGLGEVGGRLVAGQEMDVAEIGFEAITGTATAPLTVGKGLYDAAGYKMVGGRIVKPLYKLNGEVVDKVEIEKRLKTATPAQIAGMQIDITHDNKLNEEIKDAQAANQFDLDIDKKIQGADRSTIVALEIEKSKIGDNQSPVNKQKINDINEQINIILDKYSGAVSESVDIKAEDGSVASSQVTVTKDDAIVELKKQGIEKPNEKQISDQQVKMFEEAKTQLESESKKSPNLVTEKQAVEALKKDGIENPTAEQIKEKQDAIQESSTESVDVQQPSGDGKKVGEGDVGTVTEPSDQKNQDASEEKSKEEIDSPITPENLAENETIVETETDSKGRIFTRIKQVSEKDGVKTTDYVFNRDDKASDQRSPSEVSEDIALEDTNLEINPEEKVEVEVGLEEGQTVEYKVKQIREGKGGSGAIVTVITKDKNGKMVSRLSQEMSLVEKTKAVPKKTTIQTKIDKAVDKRPSRKQKLIKTTDYAALKNELKIQEKAAKGGVKAYSKASENISNYIKTLEKKGKISIRQLAAMTNKVLKTNLLNKKGVKKLTTYVDKVFNNAAIAEKIYETKNKLKYAKENIKSKIGTSKDIGPVLKQLFAINPLAIPLNKLDAYIKIVEEFAAPKKILNLSKLSETLKKANDILNSVEKETDSTDKSPKSPKETKEYDIKKTAREISKNKLTTEELNNFELQEDKDIADGINDLTPKDIEFLASEKDGKTDVSKIEELRVIKQNLKEGYVSKITNDLLRTINARKAANKINPVFKRITKPGFIKSVVNTYSSIRALMRGNSSLMLERIRGNTLFQIDHVLGNFNSKAIYNATLGKLASSYSIYQAEVQKLQNKINDAYNLVAYDRGKGGVVLKKAGIQKNKNDIVKANYKIRLLQLTREYISNMIDGKPNPKAESALKFAKSTIAAIKKNETEIELSTKDGEILQSLIDEFEVDGEISLTKLEKSLTSNEKKALQIYDEVNSSLSDKAIFTSATLRGNKIDILNNYSHHVVLGDVASLQESYDLKKSKFNQTSTKAGTLVERTPGVKPISFDPALSASLGVSETLLDYHMTNPIKQVFETLNVLNETLADDPKSKDGAVQAAIAVKKATTEALDNVFGNQFENIGMSTKLFNQAKKIGYQVTLASIPRAAAELTSNASFAFIMDAAAIAEGKPPPFINGVKKYGKLSTRSVEGASILKNLGSTQTDKLYNTTEGTGKMLDFSESKQIDRSEGKAIDESNFIGKIKKIVNKSGVDDATILPYTIANKVNNFLLSSPDQAISRPLWYESFANKFQEITGEKITADDFKKIGEGKSKFLGKEYVKAIKESRQKADAVSIQMASTTNPFAKVLDLEVKPSDSGIKTILKTANAFMSNFIINEFSTARAAVTALYNNGKGDISRIQAVGLLTAVSTRMVSYMLLYDMFKGLFDTAFGAEESEDDQSLKNKAEGQLLGSIATLALRGTKGSLPMVPINALIEYVNETGDYFLGDTEYFARLRNYKAYDPFFHSIVFNQLGSEDLQRKSFADLTFKTLAGPYTPMYKTAQRTTDILQRLQKKYFN